MFTIPKTVSEFLNIFKKNKYQIFIVGGAVRNLLLDREVKNWDFTTSATPEQILKLFPEAFYNNKYGTVTAMFAKTPFEVTPFRKEGEYKDQRHPEIIEWAKTVEEDLSRRDFTVNSIAFDGSNIIDPYNGQNHLKQKIITAVGDPDKRFNEDALRLLRAVRLASELGFLLDENTRISIQKNAQLITKISWERIRDELFKILASDHPSEGILFLKNLGLLTHILPELDICFVVPQKSPKRHHIYDVGTHLAMALKYCPSKDVITRFATLIHDVGKSTTFRRDDVTQLITFHNHEVTGKNIAIQIADRLRLSKKQKEKLVKLVQYHQFTVSELQTDKAVRRFITNLGSEYVQDMLDLRHGDRVGSGAKPTSWRLELFKKRLIEVQKEPFKITDLKINGNDVMQILKIKPGKQIGEILNRIFNDVEEKRLKNERGILLEKVGSLKKDQAS